MVRAVIFDLDDTLYPERAFVRSGFQAAAGWAQEHMGLEATQGLAELQHIFDAGARGNVFDLWIQSHGREPSPWVPQLVMAYREHEPRIAPYPEVIQQLGALHRHYRLGLVTDGYEAVQKRKFAALQLAPHFDAVVYSDHWGRDAWKPSPKPFQAALRRLGVNAIEAVYVGDNPDKDFLGARRAGIRAIRVRRPDGLHSESEPPSPEHAPDIEIATLKPLAAFLS